MPKTVTHLVQPIALAFLTFQFLPAHVFVHRLPNRAESPDERPRERERENKDERATIYKLNECKRNN